MARNSVDGGQIIYLLDTGKILDLKFPTFWFDNTPQGKFMLSIAFSQSKYYVDNAEYREYVWSVWQSDALDMESSAVAHVATVNGVPFIIFRSLSDLAGGGPGENEIGTFFQLAAINSAKVMLAFLDAWE